MSKGPIGVLTRGYRETIEILIEKVIAARFQEKYYKDKYAQMEKDYCALTEEKIKPK